MILIKDKVQLKEVLFARGLGGPGPLFYPTVLSDAANELIYPGNFVVVPDYQWFVTLDGAKLKINGDRLMQDMFVGEDLGTLIERVWVLIEEGDLRGQRLLVPTAKISLET